MAAHQPKISFLGRSPARDWLSPSTSLTTAGVLAKGRATRERGTHGRPDEVRAAAGPEMVAARAGPY